VASIGLCLQATTASTYDIEEMPLVIYKVSQEEIKKTAVCD
jgi:hypothetical protein